MDGLKHTKIILKACEKHGIGKVTAARIADLAVFTYQMTVESEMEAGVVDSREEATAHLDGPVPPISYEPVSEPPKPSALLLPGTPEFAEVAGEIGGSSRIAPSPLDRIRRRPPVKGDAYYKDFWQIGALAEEVIRLAPREIEIIPYGADAPLTLIGDVSQNPASKCVRLFYRIPTMTMAAPPSHDAAGNPVGKAVLDMEAQCLFYTYDTDSGFEELFEERMDKLVEDARSVFKRRPREIVSSTPIRVGSLSLSEFAASEEVDTPDKPAQLDMGELKRVDDYMGQHRTDTTNIKNWRNKRK
jgi:hypothetical protein